MDKSAIVVVCSTDRQYVRPLATMLVSALAHLEADRRVEVHIIYDDVPEAERRLFARWLGAGAVSLFWYHADRSRFVGVPLWGRFPVSVYDKLLVPDLLPADCSQALWLDGDTLVLGSIAPLWDRSAGCHAVLAVRDPTVLRVSSRFGVARYRELGLADQAPYFNAGVMLMNLTRWRRQEISRRALEYPKKYAHEVAFLEQEGLNAVLAGNWGELDQTWNRSVAIGRLGADWEIDPPATIVHFSGSLKPWTYDGRNGYYRQYYGFAGLIGWTGVRPAPSWRATMLGSFERSALRRLLYPVEQAATRLWMTSTRRLATEADVMGQA